MTEFSKKYALTIIIIFLIFGGFIGVSFVANKIGYDQGYQEGQINYSLGKIKYTVLDGLKVHFYGFVDEEEKAP
jgi:hypothetical protein